MTTDEQSALLQAVIAEPLSDEPRLVYADWLEDHEQGERAEFIRKQCQRAELERELGTLKRRLRAGSIRDREKAAILQVAGEFSVKQLKRRERELLNAYYRDWFPSPVEDWSEIVLWGEEPAVTWGAYFGAKECAVARLARGFIAEVSCPCAVWVKNDGRLAGQVCGACPLEVVRLTDREPIDQLRPGQFWWWDADDYRTHEQTPCNLPRCLWLLLPTPSEKGWKGVRYNTRADADRDLSRACIAYGRQPTRRAASMALSRSSRP